MGLADDVEGREFKVKLRGDRSVLTNARRMLSARLQFPSTANIDTSNRLWFSHQSLYGSPYSFSKMEIHLIASYVCQKIHFWPGVFVSMSVILVGGKTQRKTSFLKGIECSKSRRMLQDLQSTYGLFVPARYLA